MKNLDKISNLGVEMSEKDLQHIEGGKKKPGWWKFLNGIGKLAEAGSSLWQIGYH